MRTAKISELKARLSAHIEYVKRGEEVLILDRNTPVARLVPAVPAGTEDSWMRSLIASGAAVAPRDPSNRAKFEPRPVGPVIPQKVIDRVWEEEREGR